MHVFEIQFLESLRRGICTDSKRTPKTYLGTARRFFVPFFLARTNDRTSEYTDSRVLLEVRGATKCMKVLNYLLSLWWLVVHVRRVRPTSESVSEASLLAKRLCLGRDYAGLRGDLLCMKEIQLRLVCPRTLVYDGVGEGREKPAKHCVQIQ